MLNLLTQPIIRFSREGQPQPEVESLPGLYQALLAPPSEQPRVLSFPALRPHQHHAWHAFLTQLAVIAITESTNYSIPETSDEWAKIIRRLTPAHPGDEPWHMVVTDPTVPAFMQPPVSNPSFSQAYVHYTDAPDLLDMLVNSRNHDIKRGTSTNAHLDDWLMALITTQTMDGSPGRFNYGISRMNLGHSNRPALSIAPADLHPGSHLRRDIQALLDGYTPPEWQAGDISLMWTVPWDGTPEELLQPGELAPLYIEVCRRFRLVHNPQRKRLHCLKANTDTPRVNNETLRGRMGDPWVPTENLREGIPLTFVPDHADYNRFIPLFTDPSTWKPPFLLLPTPHERTGTEPMRLLFKAMARGQGETKGYYDTSTPSARSS